MQEETNAGQPAAKSSNSAEDMDDLMWGNMARTNKEGARPDDRDDEEIRVECEKELNLFILSAGASIKNSDGSYVNPLKIWRRNEGTYPVLAKLAKAYLSIPATSVPSERVWSRAAHVLSIKRSRLGEDVASGIMFLKENVHILRKHYGVLSQKYKNALPLELTGIPLPVDDIDIDVGQDLFLANKNF